MSTDLDTVMGTRTQINSETAEKNTIYDKNLYAMEDDAFQGYMLDGVSRTFALTIPQLPDRLQKVVANAYLLCRTVDTIEDEPAISYDQKRELCAEYTKVFEGDIDPNDFAQKLAPLLSDSTLDMEVELIKNTNKVIEISHSFDEADQQALLRCINIMGEGMVFFQEHASVEGLRDQKALDKYCYYVAGVVGEMLTDLFCNYSTDIAKNKKEMQDLSVSFGQGLQMTNILKDIWDDYERGVCWLPRETFKRFNFDIKNLENGHESTEFQQGLQHLVGIANYHLHNAFNYTLLIPPNETGVRQFCLWAIGMAVLTLRKINKNLNFSDSSQAKITRNTVKAVVVGSNISSKHDRVLKTLFKGIQIGLPLNKPKK